MILNLQERTQQLEDSEANQYKLNSLKMICTIQKSFYRLNLFNFNKSINLIV